jgi:hypothetical protein
MVVTNAIMTWSALMVYNGRCPAPKHEELEKNLDRCILALKTLTGHNKNVKKRDLQTVMDTLWAISEYRLRFPRSNAGDQHLAIRACHALLELP